MTVPQTPALVSTQLLLNVLHPTQTPRTWESERIRLNVAWDDLTVRAIVLGLAPQVHQRLTDWQLKPPPRAAAKLSVTYQASAKRSADIYRQLAEALAAFNQNGLTPIALKGIHLAARVYTDPALRPMNDIDLLFPIEQLPQAESILETLGYGGKHKSADLGAGVTKHTATFRRETPAEPGQAVTARPTPPGATPNPYLSPEADRMIEPHGSLEESWFGLKVDITPGVRERALIVELAGQPCRVLSTEDLLLHLCVHFCFHLIMGAPSMVQLADLLAVTIGQTHRSAPTNGQTQRSDGQTHRSAPTNGQTQRSDGQTHRSAPNEQTQRSDGQTHRSAPTHPHSQTLDWPTFVVRAQATHSAPYALAALTLAQKLLGAPIPAETLEQLSQATPSALGQRITNLSLADVVKRTQQKPITTLRERLRRGFADRVETASWAADWRGRWQVWQTAFNIFATDTGQMLLGKEPKS